MVYSEFEMYPDHCKVLQVTSLEEAAVALEKYGQAAHVLAGGQSLVPLMKQRLASPDVLIDVSHVTPDPIQTNDDTVTIHALTTHADIGNRDEVTERFGIIADVVPQIGDVQVRNVGTLGGALAEADPGNDWGPVVLTARGSLTAVSPRGRREIPIDEFFLGPFTTCLDHDELIETVSLPIPDENTGGAYVKAKRRQGGYGVASASVQVTLDDGVCTTIGYCCGDDSAAYVTPEEVSEVVVGTRVGEDVAEKCEAIIKDAVNPISDTRGSVKYKRNLCGVLFRRALHAACRRANGRTVEDPLERQTPENHD